MTLHSPCRIPALPGLCSGGNRESLSSYFYSFFLFPPAIAVQLPDLPSSLTGLMAWLSFHTKELLPPIKTYRSSQEYVFVYTRGIMESAPLAAKIRPKSLDEF